MTSSDVVSGDLNLAIVRPLFAYVEHTQGAEALRTVGARTGIDADAVRSGRWITVAEFERLLEVVHDMVQSDAAFVDACRFRLMESYGPLILPLRVGTVVNSYRILAATMKFASRISTYELAHAARNTVTMRYRTTREESRLMCLSRKAQLPTLPTLFWKVPIAHLTESTCVARGDDCCEYRITWSEPLAWRWPLAGALVGGVGALVASLGIPYVVVLALAGGLAGAVYALRRMVADAHSFHMATMKGISTIITENQEAIAQITDLSERQEAASRVERLNAFTKGLAEAVTPEDVAKTVVELGLVTTAARSAGLWLLSSERQTATLVYGAGTAANRAEDFADVPIDREPRMPILDAIRDGKAVWVQSADAPTASIPLFVQGRCIGGLAITFAGPRRFDDDERTFLELLSWHAAHAIERSRLYDEAREADRLKDEFLAMLGHELRNPLTPIVAALDIMRLRNEPALASERALISRHMDHVVRLVDDLLDVARVTRGQFDLQREPCELSTVVAKAVEQAIPLFEQKAQRLTTTVPERGLVVMADSARLTQAIANLLSNASRYTQEGGEISIVASSRGTDAVVRVRDSGIGIDAETLPRVFDLFVQERRTLERAQGGLGIGLTVVKRIVELHEGTVSAHSEGRGKGTELVIRLPLAKGDVQVAPAFVPTATPSRGALAATDTTLRVLVVDDNVEAAKLVGEALEMFGCKVQVAHDGASALVVASKFAPELALVDIGLPILDGYEVAERLRKMRVAPRRIVALTGYGQAGDKRRSLEAGFDEHVVKPIEIHELKALVDRHRA